MDLADLAARFAVALGIGLLIGLERGWKAREGDEGSRAAGIRTFAISGLLGGIVAALALALGGPATAGGGFVLGICFAAYSGVFVWFCHDQNVAEKSVSATTAIAGMVTFALGAYAILGDALIAAAAAVATTGLLAIKEDLHGWVERITWPELRSGLVLLAMTLIALPLVPDESIGPFGGVNPREVWLIAIVLAGVSFLGYLAVRHFGASHGVLLASAAGGLVSSTAVAAANARRAAAGEGSAPLLAAGTAIATAISFLRVIAIVVALKPDLLAWLAPPLLAATLVASGYGVATAYWRNGDGGKQAAVKFRNPFGFWAVVGFAVLLSAIILIGRAISEIFGASGAIVGAATLGLADVDAVTVSMARLVPQPLGPTGATFAILAAVASNTLSKLALGVAVGRGRFAIEVVAMTAGCLIAGALALAAAMAVAGWD
jgi:uncharacterized membrane protein (DUF4010 family)